MYGFLRRLAGQDVTDNDIRANLEFILKDDFVTTVALLGPNRLEKDYLLKKITRYEPRIRSVEIEILDNKLYILYEFKGTPSKAVFDFNI